MNNKNFWRKDENNKVFSIRNIDLDNGNSVERVELVKFHLLIIDIWNMLIRWGFCEGDWVEVLKVYQILSVLGLSYIYILEMLNILNQNDLILFKKVDNSESFVNVGGKLVSHMMVWVEWVK